MIKLLAVDDEKGICSFLRDFFSERGYMIFTALNGKDALAIIKKERPNIVFLDIKMPEMDGLEVLKRIKEMDNSIKVIMVTVAGDQATKDKAKELGADEYIIKPFNLNYLEEVVIKKISELMKRGEE